MFTRKLYLFTIVLLVLAPGYSFSQKEMKDQLFWVREEIVKVGMWEQYERTSKQWVEKMTEAGLDLPFVRASQRDDGHYYYLIPLESFADIDNMFGKFGAAVEKIGIDKWRSFMVENESSMESHRDFIVKWSAAHSYVPKEPRVKSDEIGFLHWIFFTFKLEKRTEVLDVLNEWKMLYEKNNSPDGWNVYLIELGLDNNMIALSEAAKDGASFYSNMEENMEKFKDEEAELWSRLSANLLSIEQKFGQPRPDLSYYRK